MISIRIQIASIAFAAAALVALVPTPAHALIELKAGYSMLTTSPGDLNDAFATFPKVSGMTIFSADVMASLPLLPVGMGVRYETIGAEESSGAMKSKVEWKRMSVLVNKRFIDTGIYLGPVATVSVANDFKYKTSNGGTETDYKSGEQLSATVGLEAGLKLMLFRVGAEVGYFYAPIGELKDSDGAVVNGAGGSPAKVDMSGPYYRAMIGFGF